MDWDCNPSFEYFAVLRRIGCKVGNIFSVVSLGLELVVEVVTQTGHSVGCGGQVGNSSAIGASVGGDVSEDIEVVGKFVRLFANGGIVKIVIGCNDCGFNVCGLELGWTEIA